MGNSHQSFGKSLLENFPVTIDFFTLSDSVD